MTEQTISAENSAPQKTLLITDSEFWEQYKPVKNSIDKNAAWEGCMLETYGKELEKAKAADDNKIWTVLETDDGDMTVSAGFHRVNRMGYIVTEVAAKNEWTEVVDEPLKFFKRIKREGGLSKIDNFYELSDGMKVELDLARASWSKARKPI